MSFSWRKGLLLLGDLLILNLCLLLAMEIRDRPVLHAQAVLNAFVAFNILHFIWILVFHSSGLYDFESFLYPREVEKRTLQSFSIILILSIIFFYVVPFFSIQPKTILALDITFASLLIFAWRKCFTAFSHNIHKVRVLLCGSGPELSQLEDFLKHKTHLGFELCKSLLVDDDLQPEYNQLKERLLHRLEADRVDVLAVTSNICEKPGMRGFFYNLICQQTNVVGFSRLYEELTGKVPVSMLNEAWLLDNLWEFDKRGFEIVKRIFDVTVAAVLAIPVLVIFPLVAIAIKLDSSGPVLYRQKRVGKDGAEFDLIKFRSMVHNAEAHGAQWAVEGDTRITRVGSLLRKTRIDEFPQLWNVLQGTMSLVGPRPERLEFVQQLAQCLPFYETRHLVKPGLTGWAQINFRYGASTEDAREKLQYDIYYIKNRSLTLECSILLKTISTMLRYKGR